MKQVRIDSLLEPPQDGAACQREWTTRGQCGEKGLFLELALFAGLVGPGLYGVSALCGFSPGMLVGLAIVVLGYGLPHAVFLGRMERSWRSVMRPGSSWISRGSIFAGAFIALAALSVAHYIAPLNTGPLQAGSAGHGVIVNAATIAAVLLAVYPGFMFSVVRAIPFWNSMLLLPLFGAQTVGGGLALALMLDCLPGVTFAAKPTALALEPVVLLATAALIAAHLHSRRRAGQTARQSSEMLIYGAYRRLFIGGVVLAGLVAPLLLTALALAGSAPDVLVFPAAVGQLGGILLFKYCFLNVGLYSPIYIPRLARPQT